MTTAYESWVTALRRWQHDPTTDLTQLPELTVSSLPPSAFERLFAHLNRSLVAMSQHAWQQFTRSFQNARDNHERTAAIVALRGMLGRQLQLAQNPRLPEEIRNAIRQAAERDLTAAQADLESAAVRSTDGGGSNRDGAEAVLRLLRTNSLTAILAPGFDIESLYRRVAVDTAPRVAVAEHPQIPNPVAPVRAARRRVLADD